MRYDLGKGDKKRSRYRTIKRILMGKHGVHGKGLTKDKLNNHDNHSYKTGPNSFLEGLQLFILETKAGHDGLYDEILKILNNFY